MIDRIEPEVTAIYRKDLNQERFLDKLNSILAPYEEEEYINTLSEKFPTLHVIGVPRSGTTLLMQLLASHVDIGYINNLIAAFWRAPVYGIRLSKQVISPCLGSSYISEFGRTKGIQEPHEFGYFWTELLNYKEMQEYENKDSLIDWQKLKIILINMTYAWNAPIAFKSFLLGWHIQKMQAILPKTCWIHISRDPLQNILSILDLRRQFLGSVEKWASLKPREFEWLKKKGYLEQVVGQVYFLEKRYIEQLKKISSSNRVGVSYEELCNNPKQILEDIVNMANRHGGRINITTQPPETFQVQRYDISSHPDGKKVYSIWQQFIEKYGELDSK